MFVSNIPLSFSCNLHTLLKKGETRTFRALVRPTWPGTFFWRFGDQNAVDSTWDDMGNLEHAIPPGSDGYPYYEEAKANTEYYNKIQHYMFGLTTQEIRHFVPDSSYAYTSSDGKCQLTPVGECVHIRANEVPDLQVQANVVELAPEATGTRYGQ